MQTQGTIIGRRTAGARARRGLVTVTNPVPADGWPIVTVTNPFPDGDCSHYKACFGRPDGLCSHYKAVSG